MKFSIAHLALASCAAALPTSLESRAAVDDLDILNFALTLEHLEDAFYHEGLKKFSHEEFARSGYLPRYRFNIREISNDESTHVQFLTAAITGAGGKAVAKCEYDFGLTNVDSFASLASILEGVGVTAYLGAAALITNKAYLTPAGSILTVEARHDAYHRDNHLPGPESPFAQPFDAPQSISEVYSLASQFIKKCPESNPTIPAVVFPTLTSLATGVAKAKDVVTLQVDKTANLKKIMYAAFAANTGPVFTPVTVDKDYQAKITIPEGVAGQSYVVLTDSKTVDDSTIIAGPAIVAIQSPYTYGGFPK